jgi:hypothetical protein
MTAFAQYNFTSSDGTTAQFALGTFVEVKGATWQYLLADGAIVAYDAVVIQNDFDASPLTTALSAAGPRGIGVAQFAVADNEYFWCPVGPFGPYREDGSTKFKVNALASCVTDVKLYTTATAGSVDDTATDLIAGLLLTETIVGAEAADCIAFQKLVTNCQD